MKGPYLLWGNTGRKGKNTRNERIVGVMGLDSLEGANPYQPGGVFKSYAPVLRGGKDWPLGDNEERIFPTHSVIGIEECGGELAIDCQGKGTSGDSWGKILGDEMTR